MASVRPKKFLGQHFLKSDAYAKKIADTLLLEHTRTVMEIGPGTGVLTKFLLTKDIDLFAVEIDRESIPYLKIHFPELKNKLIEGDFLKLPVDELFENKQVAVIGNYPYHISSQIIFKAIEYRDYIPELSGMFQRELAQRIAADPGSKTYGVISVLTQAFYDVEYLFTVPPEVFTPPPKVKSGVIRLVRKQNTELPCGYKLFRQVVKQGFNMRRKTLRNSLKPILPPDFTHKYLSLRPEQLGVDEFVEICLSIQQQRKA